jgi:hypothetical protein
MCTQHLPKASKRRGLSFSVGTFTTISRNQGYLCRARLDTRLTVMTLPNSISGYVTYVILFNLPKGLLSWFYNHGHFSEKETEAWEVSVRPRDSVL